MQAIELNLRRHVEVLCSEIGPRSIRDPDNLERARDYVGQVFGEHGYEVQWQDYTWLNRSFYNVMAELAGEGNSHEVVVVGAHYDTVPGTVGADDNASAVAGLLELARLFREARPPRTLRFVAFTLEEPPAFLSPWQGSRVYARWLHQRGERVVAMLCLEMLGYYSDEPNSQHFPFFPMRWFYPLTGNFIAVVANLRSRALMVQVRQAMRRGCDLPVESLSAPPFVPGISFSDHASFWKYGYPAVMITDTAFYRNPHYHQPGDRPETLDFVRMAACVRGVEGALGELCRAERPRASVP